MTGWAVRDEDPDRLYTVTGGRSRADETGLDLVTLIVAEAEPVAGMQSEHVRILRFARRPVSVVELSAELELPVSVVKILLADLLAAQRVSARRPSLTGETGQSVKAQFLERVLVGLHNL
jgi:hypothetical protein